MNTTKKLACLAVGLCLAQVSHAQITIVGGTPTIGFLGSTKTQVTTTHNGATQVSFDATGADKLVVVYAAESVFNNTSVTSLSMSFNGVPMILARFQQTLPNPILNDNGAVANFYLDDPFQGAANFTAGFAATAGGANGGLVSIFGLTGTADGIGAVAGTSHVDVVITNNVGTSITTTAANSLVIAGIQVSGSNNVSGSIPTAVSPLTPGNNSSWGTNWAHSASGFQAVAGSGTTIAPTFVSGTSRYVDVAAVEFTVPVPPCRLRTSTLPSKTWTSSRFPGLLMTPNSVPKSVTNIPGVCTWKPTASSGTRNREIPWGWKIRSSPWRVRSAGAWTTEVTPLARVSSATPS